KILQLTRRHEPQLQESAVCGNTRQSLDKSAHPVGLIWLSGYVLRQADLADQAAIDDNPVDNVQRSFLRVVCIDHGDGVTLVQLAVQIPPLRRYCFLSPCKSRVSQ